MYKNQLQELAQHSCFNLPSYACVREGPDHAPRFKATVNFNGDLFESPAFFPTLRQAEHAAAEVALNTLAKRGPSRTLAAKVLDETGVYKNLLQETAHRAGLNLPVYTTMRSGPGHVPVFSSTVELGGMSFKGELAKTKKQAQKNAAMSAWYALKQMSQQGSSSSPLNSKSLEEQEQVVVARFLENLNPPDSSKLPQSNQPKERPRPSSTFKSSFPSSASVDSQSHNRASCNLPPEMALHHIWLQQQAAEHQRHLMALGVSIPPLAQHRPVAPWMHPVLHPSNHPFSVTPLYFGNQLVQEPIKARSMVTIQEIHAEKPGDTSRFSPSEALVTNQGPNFLMNKKLKEDKDDILPQNGNTTSVSLEVQEKGSSEHTSDRRTSSGVQHSEPKLQNPVGVESCRPSPKMNHAPTSSYANRFTPVGHNQMNFRPVLPAPRMQRGQNPFSRRPILGRMQSRDFHAPFMAPAVQIRSVVPVCSAAPPRNTKSSNQERPSTDDMRNAMTGDVSGVSSNLKNLHI